MFKLLASENNVMNGDSLEASLQTKLTHHKGKLWEKNGAGRMGHTKKGVIGSYTVGVTYTTSPLPKNWCVSKDQPTSTPSL